MHDDAAAANSRTVVQCTVQYILYLLVQYSMQCSPMYMYGSSYNLRLANVQL